MENRPKRNCIHGDDPAVCISCEMLRKKFPAESGGTQDQAVLNTDRELWRRIPDDYYSPSVHVTEGGGIGMNLGGRVYVLPLEEWHKLAAQRAEHFEVKVESGGQADLLATQLRKQIRHIHCGVLSGPCPICEESETLLREVVKHAPRAFAGSTL